MRRIVLFSMMAMLPGCAAALDESGFAGLASSPDSVLVYQGHHWAAGTYVDEIGEEEILHGTCAGSADGLQTDRFFDVVIDLAPDCPDAEPVSYQASFGVAGLARNGTKLAFTSVVHVSRDGLLFVEDGEWSAYAGGTPSAPSWTGDLAGDALTMTSPVEMASFDGETWSLSAGSLDASTGCPAGALEGTVTWTNGTACPVAGTLTFTPVVAEPREGAVYVSNADDE